MSENEVRINVGAIYAVFYKFGKKVGVENLRGGYLKVDLDTGNLSVPREFLDEIIRREQRLKYE